LLIVAEHRREDILTSPTFAASEFSSSADSQLDCQSI